MKLYLKRLRNAIPVAVSKSKDGPYHVIGGVYLARIATPAQICNLNRVVDNERDNPVEEVEVSEDVWDMIRKANGIPT